MYYISEFGASGLAEQAEENIMQLGNYVFFPYLLEPSYLDVCGGKESPFPPPLE